MTKNRLWCEAVAIAGNDFVEDVNRRLKDKGDMVLKEPPAAYSTLSDDRKESLSYENTDYIDATTRDWEFYYGPPPGERIQEFEFTGCDVKNKDLIPFSFPFSFISAINAQYKY